MESRYLKRRGRRWYFQLAVPADLQKSLGRKVIVEALNTDDLQAARQLRWPRLAAAHGLFESAGETVGLTTTVIEREAQATLSRLLREAEVAANQGNPLHWPAPEAAAAGSWPAGTTEGEGLAFAAETFAEAMAARSYDLVEVEAAAVVISLDLNQDPDDETLDRLCQSQLAAHHEAVKGRIAKLQGTPYDPRAMLATTLRAIQGDGPRESQRFGPGKELRATGARAKAGAGGGLTISEAAAACLAAHAILGGHERQEGRGAARPVTWSAATRRQYQTTLRLFANFKNNAPLTDVSNADAAQFIAALGGLDPRWHRAPGSLALGFAALVRHHTRPPGLSRKTIDRHVSAGAAVFAWAIAAHHFTAKNPFDGLYGAVSGTATRPIAALSQADLRTLIGAVEKDAAAAPDSLEAALHWAIHLALFGGLRQREICQLRPQDVEQRDGVWAVYAGAGPRRRGRLVPLHRRLLDAGIVAHWEKIQQRDAMLLFPALTDHRPGQGAARLSRALAHLARRCRGRGARPAGGAVGFRSLRANTRAALADAAVPDRVAAAVLGIGRPARTARGTNVTPADLATAIGRIEFAGLSGGN